jgi:hypothetical protein
VTAASVGIIWLSNDSLVENIKIQPQVLLAILSTIVNALLAFALVEGLTIHFWKQAGCGMTVRQKTTLIFLKLTNVWN